MTQSTTRTIATGTITYTATGLIHRTNSERFVTELEQDAPKKNGRPFKDADQLKVDFSAFLTPVKLAAPAGRVIRFK